MNPVSRDTWKQSSASRDSRLPPPWRLLTVSVTFFAEQLEAIAGPDSPEPIQTVPLGPL
jgi:hypothetical protein